MSNSVLKDSMKSNIFSEEEAENGGEPYLLILENPKSRGFRFRYTCEGPSHGGIPGASSDKNKKTFPAVRISNYQGYARIVVQLVTNEENPRLHPHSLVGKQCQNGICTVQCGPKDMTATFPNLGIQHVTKKNVASILEERYIAAEMQLSSINHGFPQEVQRNIKDEDRKRIAAKAQSEAKSIDLSVVRLMFIAYLPDNNGAFTIMLKPVISEAIYDSKAPNAATLKICRMDCSSGSASGGDEVYLLCDKVQKDDIQVRFLEEDMQGNELWEGYGNFCATDVHRQFAIVFRTPAYKDQLIKASVNVQVQLRRKSDGEVSEARPFCYLPNKNDMDMIDRKRRKVTPNYLDHIQNSSGFQFPSGTVLNTQNFNFAGPGMNNVSGAAGNKPKDPIKPPSQQPDPQTCPLIPSQLQNLFKIKKEPASPQMNCFSHPSPQSDTSSMSQGSPSSYHSMSPPKPPTPPMKQEFIEGTQVPMPVGAQVNRNLPQITFHRPIRTPNPNNFFQQSNQVQMVELNQNHSTNQNQQPTTLEQLNNIPPYHYNTMNGQMVSGTNTMNGQMVSGINTMNSGTNTMNGQMVSGIDTMNGQMVSGTSIMNGQMVSGTSTMNGQMVNGTTYVNGQMAVMENGYYNNQSPQQNLDLNFNSISELESSIIMDAFQSADYSGINMGADFELFADIDCDAATETGQPPVKDEDSSDFASAFKYEGGNLEDELKAIENEQDGEKTPVPHPTTSTVDDLPDVESDTAVLNFQLANLDLESSVSVGKTALKTESVKNVGNLKNELDDVAQTKNNVQEKQATEKINEGISKDIFSSMVAKMSESMSSALHDFSMTGDVRMLLILQRQLAMETNEYGDTVLHVAVMYDQLKVLSWLIDVVVTLEDRELIINAQNKQKQTALHIAVLTDNVEAVMDLLKAGANPLVADENGNHSIHVASKHGNADVLRRLLRSTKDKVTLGDVNNFRGFGAFHLAARSTGNTRRCLLLLSKFGWDVNKPDKNSGKTALHMAVDDQNLLVASCLLSECDAALEVTTYDNTTPLQKAVAENCYELVTLLLASGAETDNVNDDGNTVFDLATTEKMKELLDGNCICLSDNEESSILNDSYEFELCELEPGLRLQLCGLLNSKQTGSDWFALADRLELSVAKKRFLNAQNPADCLLDEYALMHGTVDGLRSALMNIRRHDAVQLLNRACAQSYDNAIYAQLEKAIDM